MTTFDLAQVGNAIVGTLFLVFAFLGVCAMIAWHGRRL